MRSLLLLPVVGIAAISALASPDPQPRDQGLREHRRELARVFAGTRPFQARLTGGFAWLPARSSGATPPFGELARLVRLLEGDDNSANVADAGRLADLAALQLYLGKRDDAVAQMERAVAMSPDDVNLLSDLAACHLAAHELAADPEDLLSALESSERALSLPHPPPEAFFNSALATQWLYLDERAKAAWRRYLEIDPQSPWSAEAREHLAALDRPTERDLWPADRDAISAAAAASQLDRVDELVRRHPLRSRLWTEEELLTSWAREHLASEEPAASRHLATARVVAASLARTGGDQLLRDAVAAIDGATDDKRLQLARGHIAYSDGLARRGLGADKEAGVFFNEALAYLSAGGSAYAGWARFRRAQAGYYSGANHEVVAAVQRLEQDISGRPYAALDGRARLLSGMANGRLAQIAAALRDYHLGLDRLGTTGETDHVGAAHMMIGENLGYQGDELAWGERLLALGETHGIGDSIYYYNAIRDGAEELLRQGRLRSALALQDELLVWTARQGEPMTTVETLIARSRTHHRLGDDAQATADLDKATRLLDSVPAGERHLRLATDIQLARADADPNGVSQRALTDAIRWAESRDDHFRLIAYRSKRAAARLGAGDQAGGIADLEAGIGEYERQQGAIEDPDSQARYLDQARPLYDEMIALRLRRGQTDVAFRYAEACRAPVLSRQRAAARGTAAVSLADVAAALPAGTALVELAVLPTQSVAWVVSVRGNAIVELDIGRAALAAEVERLHAGATGRRSPEDFAASVAALSRAVWDPIRPHLRDAEQLVIVADDSLNLVPFALLEDAASGKRVIETATVRYSPSATFFVAHRGSAGDATSREPRSALVLADPSLDPLIFPALSRLPAAVEEAGAVAALYPEAKVLTGDAATRGAFEQAAPGSEVVHIAAHALNNLRFPALSMVPLARGEDGSDALSGADIERLRLGRTRLVVLGGCSTAAGPISATEGAGSLARQFLAAGVSEVVASLWPIDDRTARTLMVDFHRRLRRGEPTAEALRGAQLESLRSGRQELADPRTWAAYQLIGGQSADRKR